MNNVSIRIKDLSKVYRIYERPKDRLKEAMSIRKKKYGYDHYALKDINIDVHEGEILGIIGVNGSGKSTLLKIITGVLSPTTGTVSVNGKISALLELGAGFNPEYTGIENIYFNGMVMGFTRKEMEQKVDDIVAFADIGEFIHQPVKVYSSGMYIRLAYAVAVSIEPDILIVDEALAVGDAYFQMKSMSKMQDLFRKGKTVLLVSHDTASVKALCNNAIYLDKGQIIARGSAKEVVELYETNIRSRMSQTKGITVGEEIKSTESSEFNYSKKDEFKIDEEYEHLVNPTREGSGEARVRCLEILDLNYKAIRDIDFNQRCIIRIHVEFIKDCSISIGYHIRDDKNVPILGSNTYIEGKGEISGKAGDKLIVDFITNLPLIDGKYNIMSVLSHNIILNRSAAFIDITKDGLYFIMQERKNERVWNKVQLANDLEIKRCH